MAMLSCQNGFEYRNTNLQVLNGNIFVTFCTNLIKIDPITPDIMREVTVTFGMRRQK